MNIFINYTKKLKLIFANYLTISILSRQLQSSYLAKSIYTIILILIALLSYILLSSGLIFYIERSEYFNIIYNLVIIFTVLDLFFLKFNLII